MRLREIMTADVKTVRTDDSAEHAFQQMQLHRVRHLVVMERTYVVGVLSDRDLGAENRANLTVGDVMTPQVVSGSPDMSIRDVANLFRGRKINCLPVLEEEELVGIVTSTDLLDLLGRGAEKPSPKGTRATLRKRGPKRASRNAPQPRSH